MPLNECSLDPHHSRLTDVTDLITMTTRTSIRQPVCNHSNRAAVAEADRARDSRTDRQTDRQRGGCRGEVRCSAFQSISRSRRACHVTFRDANSHRPGCLSVRVRLPTLLSTLYVRRLKSVSLKPQNARMIASRRRNQIMSFIPGPATSAAFSSCALEL